MKDKSSIIQATLITETPNAWYLNCEEDKVWFPKSKVNFNIEKQELEAPNWLLNQKFPDESFTA